MFPGGLFGRLQFQGPLLDVLGKVARVGPRTGAGDLHGGGGELVQEPPVVGNGHQGAPVGGQVPFQPLHALRVEVVGGFVQEEDIGPGEQDRRQGNPHLPPPREFARLAAQVLPAEAQAIQDLGRHGLEAVAVQGFVGVDQPFVPCQEARPLPGAGPRFGEPVAHLGELPLDAGYAGFVLEELQQGAVADLDEVLGEVPQAPPGREGDLPLVGGDLTGDKAEKSGLAGPVVADDSHPRPRGDRQGHPVEDPPPPEGEGDTGAAYHGVTGAFPRRGRNRAGISTPSNGRTGRRSWWCSPPSTAVCR